MITDPAEVAQLREAHYKIRALAANAIERARLFLEMKGKPFQNFINGNGFSVKVDYDSLLDERCEKVFFYTQDVQGRGDVHTVEVPRDFIFSSATPTTEEAEFLEYKRLKAKYEG